MKDRVELPATLRGIFFDFRWDTSLVWALPTPTELFPLGSLAWHLDLPVWTTVPGQPRFDLAPRTVLASPEGFPRRWKKIRNADLSYALEMFENRGRWVILDGYHRLSRHWLDRSTVAPVRRHPPAARELIVPTSLGT